MIVAGKNYRVKLRAYDAETESNKVMYKVLRCVGVYPHHVLFVDERTPSGYRRKYDLLNADLKDVEEV